MAGSMHRRRHLDEQGGACCAGGGDRGTQRAQDACRPRIVPVVQDVAQEEAAGWRAGAAAHPGVSA